MAYAGEKSCDRRGRWNFVPGNRLLNCSFIVDCFGTVIPPIIFELGPNAYEFIHDIRSIFACRLARLRLPSSSGHPICTDLVSVGEDVHCEFVKEEVHPGVPAGGGLDDGRSDADIRAENARL